MLTSTRPDADQTAKVSVADLPEGGTWFYRFTTLQGTEVSRTGRLRLAPQAKARASLSFGIGGCANGQYAPFPFLDWSGASQPNLDLFWMLGDVAYGKRVNYPDFAGGLSPEVANPLDPAQPGRPEQTLAGYHEKYRLNLTATGPANASFASLYAAQGVYALFDNNDLQGDTFIEAGGSPRDMVRIALSDAHQAGTAFPSLFEAEGTSNTDFFRRQTISARTRSRPSMLARRLSSNSCSRRGAITSPCRTLIPARKKMVSSRVAITGQSRGAAVHG